MDGARIASIADRARAEGRSALTELEGMEVLEAMGLATPRRVLIRGAAESAAALEAGAGLPGEKVVVKVVSPAILHKTEVGGVAIARNSPREVEAAVGGHGGAPRGPDRRGLLHQRVRALRAEPRAARSSSAIAWLRTSGPS